MTSSIGGKLFELSKKILCVEFKKKSWLVNHLKRNTVQLMSYAKFGQFYDGRYRVHHRQPHHRIHARTIINPLITEHASLFHPMFGVYAAPGIIRTTGVDEPTTDTQSDTTDDSSVD